MAIAKVATLLSLDRYAKIMGINPVFFNQAGQVELADGKFLFPHGAGMPNLDLTWHQFSWDLTNAVSREQVAEEIRRAENDIESFLGYPPAPRWIENELHDMPSHYYPEIGVITHDLLGDRSGFRVNKRKFIAGGRRAVTLIDTIAVTYVDEDGDGWAETARVVVDIGTIDSTEVKVYFEGHDGDRTHEIRPAKSKTLAGTTLTIDFDAWKFIKPDLWYALPTNDISGRYIDINTTDNFVVNVEVYREYNDTTQDQIVFYYEPSSCAESETLSEQGGFLKRKNIKSDFVYGVPADYNTSWSQVSISGYIKRVSMWYLCGNKIPESENEYGDYLDTTMARLIAHLATARLARPLAGNINVTAFSEQLQQDLVVSSGSSGYRFMHDSLYENPFGTHFGEVIVWRALKTIRRKR